VTSSFAGNILAGEKIKCYVGSASHSTATTVGTTMTISPVFTAGDQPKYTRTNAAGHESVASATDGTILRLYTATAANVAVIVFIFCIDCFCAVT
ncbi:unnamed protein product, partial [marine sediment metagenome]